MPIDVDQALGATMEAIPFAYEERDVLLYALAVGLGDPPTDPQTLAYTYENGLTVLPTFGVIPPFAALMGLAGVPGMEINPMMILHGEQYLELKGAIPTSGTLTSTPKIAGIYDKGKGALILMDVDTIDAQGNWVCYNQFSIFVRGEGGFGGERGPSAGAGAPDRAPDATEEFRTLPQQALLYRLCGDRNPLHADPGMASMVGFEQPILHGLCTFGVVGHAVLKHYCGYDAAKFKSIKVRFSGHVFPGETIVTQMWRESDTRVALQAKVQERDTICVSNAVAELNP